MKPRGGNGRQTDTPLFRHDSGAPKRVRPDSGEKQMPYFRTLAMLLAILCGFGHTAEAWTTFTTEQGLPGNEIQFLKADPSGGVWVGTMAGLAHVKDGKVETLLKGVSVYDLLPGVAGEYWVGTSNGLAYLLDGKKTDALKDALIAPVVRYDAQTLWAIGKDKASEQNTLYSNTGGTWQAVERFKDEKVVDLVRTHSGKLWVLVDGNGVYEIDPAKGVGQAVQHLKGRNVNTIAEDGKQQVWAGLWRGGVLSFDGKTWTPHLEKEKSTVFAIRGDAKDRLWVATNANGLWLLDGGAWTQHLAGEGAVNMLATTANGDVWISTQSTGGLRRFSDGQWKSELESPLPIRCMLETADKKIWAGGVLDGLHVRP